MSDPELLQHYVQDGSADAFAAIVNRHLDLVYSVARRQLGSSSLAEDVAQSVFIELARQARTIKPGTPLIAWLHVVARRIAINAARDAARRHAREQAAAQLAAAESLESAMKPNAPHWSAVEPFLDEAVESLPEPDRAAILLRYFENKSLRDVGAALGTSDDAAQKRVTRAVEQLRAFLLRRGIAVTAAGLATDLSAHALQIAPAGLGAAVSASTAVAAGTAIYASAKATELIVMTSLQKTLLGAALTLTLGAGLFEARVAANQRVELADLQQRTDALRALTHTVRLDAERAERSLGVSRATLASPAAGAPSSPADAATTAAIQAWFQRVSRLSQILVQRPDLGTPELALLDEQTFYSLTQDAPLDTDEQIRETLARLRGIAANDLANKTVPALRAYLAAHDDQLPASAAEFAPFFNPPVDPAVLARLSLLRTGKVGDVPAREQGTGLVRIQPPVDPNRDQIWTIGRSGFSGEAASIVAVREAQKGYAAAHNGALAASPAELQPYLEWRLDPVNLQKAMTATPPR